MLICQMREEIPAEGGQLHGFKRVERVGRGEEDLSEDLERAAAT